MLSADRLNCLYVLETGEEPFFPDELVLESGKGNFFEKIKKALRDLLEKIKKAWAKLRGKKYKSSDKLRVPKKLFNSIGDVLKAIGKILPYIAALSSVIVLPVLFKKFGDAVSRFIDAREAYKTSKDVEFMTTSRGQCEAQLKEVEKYTRQLEEEMRHLCEEEEREGTSQNIKNRKFTTSQNLRNSREMEDNLHMRIDFIDDPKRQKKLRNILIKATAALSGVGAVLFTFLTVAVYGGNEIAEIAGYNPITDEW